MRGASEGVWRMEFQREVARAEKGLLIEWLTGLLVELVLE